MTACISPSPARASSRIMSSARSAGCWRRVPRRSSCRPNRRRPTPMRCPVSRRRVRSRDRSCRWWHLPSAPINCSAARAPARPPVDALAARTLVKGEPLAPPAGRADDFVWPRREVGREQAKGETPVASVGPDGTVAAPGTQPKPKKPLPVLLNRARLLLNRARRRCGTSSALAMRRAGRRRRVHRPPVPRARRLVSGDRRRYRAHLRGKP